MTQQLQDEGFHEIQLNGKQLVFLFMAATVLSVGIFLCGVLVGRGAHSVKGGVADDSPLTTVAKTVPQQPAPVPAPAGSDPTAAAPPPAADDLTYFNRLEKPSAARERLKPRAEAAASPAPPPTANPVNEPPRSPAVPGTAAALSEPATTGFAVQIAALNVRSEADAIAKRLSTKGYTAYVLAPANGTPTVYRVRVGKFPTRREAETVAAKLQREEQYKPWVTR